MFSVFPSSPLSRRFSIIPIILILAGPTKYHGLSYLQEHESTASVRPVSSFNESAAPPDNGEDGKTENTQGRPDSSYSLQQ